MILVLINATKDEHNNYYIMTSKGEILFKY